MECNFVKLGEVAEVKGGKRLPKGTSLTDTRNSHPYLRIVDFKMLGIDENNLKYVPDSVFEKISRYIINTDDVFLSIVGTIGLTGILPSSLNGASLTENAVKIISKDKEVLNPYYLMYYLSSPEGQFQISIRTVGSTQPKLAITRIKDIPIPLLDIEKQNKIVEIIHSLTEKVELNTQIIENLEYLAQTLFKRWFIDFEFPNEDGEPYKSSGGIMKEGINGQIPYKWKDSKLQNISLNFDRKRVPLSKLEREKRKKIYPYYGAASLMDYVDEYLFEGVHVLLGEDGSVIDKKGFPIMQYVWGRFWVNNHAHVLKGKAPFSDEYIYMLLKQTNVKNIVTGAVQPKINQSNLNNINAVIPEEDILEKFNSLVDPLFKKIRLAHEEKETAIKLRDTLLPKLLSGEIELPDETEVTEHVPVP